MKGKYIRTEDIKRKVSETRRKRIEEGKIVVWNKGLTKADPRVLKNISGGCRKTQFKPGPRPENVGVGNANWKGGKHIDVRGYVYLRRPKHPYAKNNYVQEHRIIMEKKLGRLLLPTEIVHHINHNTGDNRLDNLMLLTPSQHATMHNLGRWGKKEKSKRRILVVVGTR